MKLAAKAVDSYIAKPAPEHRAVLLYGPDSGLVRERAKALANIFLGVKPDPMALSELTESRLSADPALLSDELLSISMLAPKRVITITDAKDKLTRIIEEAIPSIPESSYLIVCADELGTKSSLRLSFENSKAAPALPCYHDETGNVMEIIRKAFAAADVSADRDAVEYLSQQLGNDRYVTHQEVQKLIVFAGDSKKLSLEDVQSLVDYNRETSFDDMVNAVADRDLKRLETTLTLLLRDGTSPVAYVRALLRYFNRLYYVNGLISDGKSPQEAIDSLRPKVFFRQVPIMSRHIQKWNTDQAVKAINLLMAAELACKTSDLPIVPASSRRLLQVTQVR